MTSNSIPMPILDAAFTYRAAGLSVIAARTDKTPVMAWKQYQDAPATDEQIAGMFFDTDVAQSLGVVCGRVSGGLECIDFDAAGTAFEPWRELVAGEDPAILKRVVMARTPSGGLHVIYRCPEATIPGSQKLAMRPTPAGRHAGGQTVLIETRGEGGYFCAAPGPGYAFVQHSLTSIPNVSAGQREIMLRCARFLNEVEQPSEMPIVAKPALPGSDNHYRPGDDYNQKCDRVKLAELLTRHGWRFWRESGPNVAWTRPGKERGISATMREIGGVEVFYVFTSSSSFSPMRGYSPFQVYAILEHGGDYARAASELNRQGYGSAPEDGFSAGAFIQTMTPIGEYDAEEEIAKIADPGPFPEHLLRVPGFIGDFARFIDDKNPKSQPVPALGAAIAAMGTLTGRKVEGATGLRTNFYVLNVIPSGEGKNAPREQLSRLLHDPDNLFYYTVDRLKSGAGIRSALEVNPCVIFILDEIGEWLEMIKTAKGSFWIKEIIPELMSLYSSAASPHVKMGGYSDAKKTIDLNCPHVCLYGTSVPESFYKSMTMQSVTNGFIGRLSIFEGAAENPVKKRPTCEPIPDSILDAAKWWREFAPHGMLTGTHAGSISKPILVDESAEATAIFDNCEAEARKNIEMYGRQWGGPYNRMEENARKYAIAYACSECPGSPFIGRAAAKWGTELSLYLTHRLVYVAEMNVADNDTHDKRNKVRKIIVAAGEKGISRNELTRKTQFLEPRELGRIVDALMISEEIRLEETKTKTKSRIMLFSNSSNTSRIRQDAKTLQLPRSQ